MKTGSVADVRKIEILGERAGQRLDNFLIREMKGVPREHIYRLVRTGQVRVNSRRARSSDKLCLGDIVRVPPVKVGTVKTDRGSRGHLVRRLPEILCETDEYAVFAKPAGLAVHGGSGLVSGLIERLRDMRPDESWELAHRLDRETSGVLVVARRLSWLREFHKLLRDGKVRKTYAAAVFGFWRSTHRVIDFPLRKIRADKGGKRAVIDGTGRSAITRTRCSSQHRNGAILEIDLVTGRTHQARAHLAYAGLPVVGDCRYGDRKCNREAVASGFERMYLHASKIEFALPGKDVTVITCAPPPEFTKLTKWLSKPQA